MINKLSLLIKQFGFKNAVLRVMKSFLKPFFYISTDIILVVDGKRPIQQRNEKIVISIIEKSDLNELIIQKTLDENLLWKFDRFLNDNCTGLLAYFNHSLSGYSFIQHKGVYKFASKTHFIIPEKISVIKNLLVYPEYRGLSIGKSLNLSSITTIPLNKYPLAFVKADNRYALRNFKLYGFKEKVKVRTIIWFSRWRLQKISLLSMQDQLTDEIIDGLSIIQH